MAIKFLSKPNLSTVTAGSILKVDSNGDIVAATAGTDYATSSGQWTGANGGIYYSDNVRVGTYSTSVAPEAKLHVFDYQTTTPKLLIQDGNTGDASMQFKISTQQYTMGIDNSDSDKFILAASSALGTTNVLEVATNGTAAFQSDLLVNGKYYLSNLWNISAQGSYYAKFSNWVNLSNTGFYTSEDMFIDLDDSSARFVIRSENNTEEFIANTATDTFSIPNWSLEANDITQTSSGDNWYNTATVEYNQTGIKLSRSNSGYVSAAPYKLIGSFTASVSFKTSNCTHLGIIFAALPSGTDDNNYGVILRNNGTDGTEVRVQKRVGGGQSYPIGAINVTSDCDDGNWHELTVSYNGKHIVVDIDGTNYINQAWTDTSFTDPGYVGLAIYDNTCQFNNFQVTETPSTTTFENLNLANESRTLDVKLATTPSTGDVGVQFRAGSGDYLGLAAGGGTGVGLVVDSSNKVGIGTTSPVSKLDFGTAAANAKLIIGTYVNGNFWSGIGMDSADAGIRIVGDGTVDSSRLVDVGYYSNDTSHTWTSRFKVTKTGAIQASYYGAGILKTDANGNVSLDTNTYLTTTDAANTYTTTDHVHTDASTESSGFMSATDKTKLNGIEDGANNYNFILEDGDGTEVNITSGSEIKFVEGAGIDINWTDTTPGSDSDPFDLTFSLKNSSVSAAQLNVTGNGTSGQVLTSDGDGTMSWTNKTANTDTITSVGVANSEVSGTVTLSGAGATSLTQTGSVIEIRSTDTQYSAATTSVAGLMSTADKTKLDGIAANATAVTNNNQLTNGAGYATTTALNNGLATKADTGHKYHSFSNGQQFYDGYGQNNYLRLFTENAVFDNFRFRSYSNVQVSSDNGQTWSESSMNLDTVLDGREETGINITHETKHFRFEINRSTGWPTTALFVIQSTWSNTSGHTGEVTLETWDGSVWIQRDSWVYSNFQRGYNLHTTTQVHNGQNSMRVTIKMDWTDATHNYIPLRRILLLSNYSGSIYDMQPFYWGYNKEVTFASSINVSGGNSGNWNTAYGWGDHAGLYLGATAKAADSELLDGIDSTGFLRVAPNSGTPLSANFAIGSAGGRNFIQSHASQPLDINPLGNSVSVGSNLTVSGNVGIGTTSPGYPLDILDNSTRLSFSTGTGNAIIYMDGANGDLAGGDYTSLTSDGSGNFSIATGNSERLRVQHGGNVGIGTDSPTGKLHVYGGRLVLDNPANAQTAIQINSAGTEKIVIYRPTSTEDLRIYTPGAGDAFTLTQSGNVGIGTTSPGAPLDVQPNSSYKVTKVGDDRTSHYKFTGQSDHTLTLASGSYHSAEVVITAHQTNGGTNNNLYIRGIWTNNHTSHHWHEIENIGGLSGSTFTIRNGQNGNTENSGELEIFHDYISASFAQMVVRVTDHYGTHSYTIS